MSKFKSKHRTGLSLNYTLRGFVLDGRQVEGWPAGSWCGRYGRVNCPVRRRVCGSTVTRWAVGRVPSSYPGLDDRSQLPTTGRSIGIDWGVTDLATTTSDAHDLAHPQHGQAAAQGLARYQRMMARRKPVKGAAASRGYKTAKRAAAKQHAHGRGPASRYRPQMGQEPWRPILIRSRSRTSGPKFLAKSTMARKAADGAIAATKKCLDRTGRQARTAPGAGQSEAHHHRLRNCGARAKHRLPLSQRTYRCEHCGPVAPRDKNSAHVIHNRAGFDPAGVDGLRPGRSPSGQAA